MDKYQASTASMVTVVTGILCCEFSELVKLLTFMTGERPLARDIPRSMDETKPYLLKQHPFLKDVKPEMFEGEIAKKAIAEFVKEHGEDHEVTKDHETLDPIESPKGLSVDESRIIKS